MCFHEGPQHIFEETYFFKELRTIPTSTGAFLYLQGVILHPEFLLTRMYKKTIYPAHIHRTDPNSGARVSGVCEINVGGMFNHLSEPCPMSSNTDAKRSLPLEPPHSMLREPRSGTLQAPTFFSQIQGRSPCTRPTLNVGVQGGSTHDNRIATVGRVRG